MNLSPDDSQHDRVDASERAKRLDASSRLEVLDGVGCGVWVYDGDNILYVNRALETITGWPPDELLQPRFFESLIHPDFRDLIVRRGQARIRGEDVPETYEVDIIAKDRSIRTLSIHARRLELPTGPVSLASAVDVTVLNSAERRIRESGAHLRALSDSVPASIIITDVSGKPTFVNKAWIDLTGMALSEALAAGTQPVIHPDDMGRATKEWMRAQRLQKPYDIDYRVRDRNGEFRWQTFRIRPVHDPNGAFLGWTSASVDIHDAKMLEERLETLNGQLSEANRAKDEILGLISHELRTPLTTVLGNANLLRTRGDELDAEDRARAVSDLFRDATRLYAVIDNMLVLSRAESNEPAEVEPVLVARLAAEVVTTFRSRSNRSVTLDTAPDLPPALANPTFYAQILGNLLSNADKYSPPGEVVEVRLTCEEGFAKTVVADRGHGIEPAEAERLFQPFYRAPRLAGRVTGIGLGLTVCQRLTELQGGRITAASREGGGCQFAFTIPLAEAAVD